ncbi:mediator of RNA polymerase II transcription subunit 26 [Trichonephila inaurata madagascariensis]|uniref:Mediator of RNA polymerase II transcription subunit 26 n=1 Tax=Trichonephila inaurata madagascariensis TaxID=2747483 RepID=A0A8X6WX10_9ARAC|nr:mediator of RNA polymerase II transcription subunit 26 [Trichonephila inaurata madagascariensis]GFY78842.1 mediator of RNA polymerase II transcription subunit 26 [Trichonephila inaurata madagascariensis]
MQHSSYEIKEKLLQALDHEYNVVDMDAVLDVITALEKAGITKDALEKTRIGKYINELRKRTTNEQLARRAKELVKSWRKLLPQRVNGEEIHNSILSSPGGITVLGPGPGPGIGPGPGPGNKTLKTCVSVPGTPRYKTSSPSLMIERSSSPYFSSASNSPLLNSSVLQGSSLTSLPSNYAPIKSGICQTSRTDANSVNKTLLNISNQSKNLTSSQNFKPVSPSVPKQDIVTSSGTCILPSRTSLSTSPGLINNSNSSSPLLNTSVNVCSQNVSPKSAFSVTHSSLDLAKTNAANKRLRKEIVLLNHTTSTELSDSKNKIGNGMSDITENNVPCESLVFNSVTSCHSNSVESDKTLPNITTRIPKRKRSFDKTNELQEFRLEDMIASLQSGSKLQKVKTTQQLIADLQAKKGLSTVLSPENLTSVDTLRSSEAEVSRTKSELLKKFLIASQSARSKSNRESPVDESSVSVSDYGSHSVPDVSSVINTNLNISSNISHPDPVDEEINKILSALPPINPAEINLDDTSPSPQRRTSVTEEDLSKLNDRWEYVNGVYDCDGTWRPWQECTEQKSYMEESFQILPYVNID